jgi:hypothetical protein
VTVRSNRPLTDNQKQLVHERLAAEPTPPVAPRVQ